jgi:hypothetical protein
MLLIEPKNWWRSLLEVTEPSTGTRFSLSPRGFREGCFFKLDGDRYELKRQHWSGGAFLLECNGSVLLRAHKPSAFKRSFELKNGRERFTVAAESMWSRAYVLRQGSRVVGRIERPSWWSRRAEADLPEDLPLVFRVFVVSLVLLMWRREHSAVVNGAG